ncbi:MAG: alpha-2-macroglobulin [Flaviaesturariibacter sp.]|nr:alpha-2-macroglobulin [Flaviaesturariibacter sp.]
MFVHLYFNSAIMKYALLFSLFTLSFLCTYNATAQKTDAYEKQWSRADSLITQKNLPKSALQVVTDIYNSAKKAGNEPQLIKALVYKAALQQENREENTLAAIGEFEKEITTAKGPAAAILQNITASLYRNYLQQFRWKLYDRTTTINVVKNDPSTWGLEDFHQKITSLYLQSLKDASRLKSTSLESFEAIIKKGNRRLLRPTLYDLLAHEALDYFKSGERDIKKAAYAFEISQSEAFAPAAQFARASFATKDSFSLQHKALLLFQDLIQFHLDDAQKDALIDVDIERLQYVYHHSVAEDKEEAYRAALQQLYDQHGKQAAQAGYLLASYYNNVANGYQPYGDTTGRFVRIKAQEILLSIVADSATKSEGWANSYNLLNQITQPQLSFTVEKVNIPQQPFRALVKYKNINSAHLRLLPADESLKKIFTYSSPANWETVLERTPLRQWSQRLPAATDLQEHNAEIKIAALPAGEYILLIASDSLFSENANLLGAQAFQVSPISFITQNENIFVLNRETGQPLNKATVAVFTQEYNYKTSKNVKVKWGSYRADATGYVQIERNKKGNLPYNYLLEIEHGKDRLEMDEQIYHYQRYDANEEEDDSIIKFHFFTDRSIYRPGQTVYFKAIVLTKSRGETGIATNYKSKLFLENANQEDIDSLQFTTNEYGSVSGKFMLPQNGLNGNFRIYEEEDDQAVSFSVEEYKRPKFYIEFEKLKGSYKAGDSIALPGVAKSYAGNVVDGAKVAYRIIRKPRFIYSWRWRMPQTASMEIGHGETTTDRKGSFTITFLAIPDKAINRDLEPFFDYEVHADVTDINGETRSGVQTVSAGYKSLLLHVSLPAKLPVDSSLRSLIIQTKNSAGEALPAAVQVRVSKLTAEPRLIRKRYWQRPDQFVMTKEEYVRHFPHDEYDSETDYKTWAKTLVLDERDSANKAGNFPFKSASKLAPGFYEVEVTSVSTNGETVKDIKYTELYEPNAAGFSRAEYLWSNNISPILEPGQAATVQISTAADNVFLISQVEKGSRQNAKSKKLAPLQFHHLDKEQKSFTYAATEEDRGGFGVGFFFVKHNRVHQTSGIINVPWTNKDLSIAYTTYRDKTQPGSEEKWSVKITGNKGTEASAEMLASMYDASLDQFKPHAWETPQLWPYYSLSLPLWGGDANFNYKSSLLKRNTSAGNKYYSKQYNQLLRPHYLINELRNKYWEQRSRKDRELAAQVIASASPEHLQEVVVTAVGVKRQSKELGYSTSVLSGKVSGLTVQNDAADASIRLRGARSGNSNAILIVDGVRKPMTEMDGIAPESILTISVLKSEEATALYGAEAANGAIIITTKDGYKKQPQSLQIRKNFNETAFFFPDLRTDSLGNISFSFTTPEALTRWKLQTVAHTKELAFGVASKEIITQKELMVQPSAPRFLRQGDHLEFTTKIVNLSGKELTGQAQLELIDAVTGQSVDGWFQNIFPNQYFTVAAGQSEVVKFPMEVPYLFNSSLTWRVVARADAFSDGEESTIPVLSNKILVTETLPIWMNGSGSKNFVFTKLTKADSSESLQHKSLTVEYTSNPAWLAVQALPYLMEYPYECAEQTWNRFYANALATKIINSSPRIKSIFNSWKVADTAALLSSLQKNGELKSALLEETPWVLEAKSEAAQKQNLALLFDAARMSNELRSNLETLKGLQSSNGGFVWFKGGPDDRYITQYIVTGMGRLRKLGALTPAMQKDMAGILTPALRYLDGKLKEDYERLVQHKVDLKKEQLSATQIQYLYMRSHFIDQDIPAATKKAYDYYRSQAQLFWMSQNKYLQGMTALALHRTGDNETPAAILRSLKETAITSEEVGMYWKDNSFGRSWFWYHAPIETQASLIEAFSEISKDNSTINALKTWLVKNKQTNNWRTTKATADACYALLLQGTDWIANDAKVQIKLGNLTINSTDSKTEEGTGYFKKVIEGDKINPAMGTISVTVQPTTLSTAQRLHSPSYGAVYWQYFEEMNNITAAATPLVLNKKLFLEKNSDRGPVLTPVEEGMALHVGDKLMVRIELKVDRDMEYVHLKDLRASGLEPVNVLSGYKWQGGAGYYESTRDASNNFFFDRLTKGTYVFEYPLFVTHTGTFSNGITTIQSMYAPEFTAHSEGVKITVE